MTTAIINRQTIINAINELPTEAMAELQSFVSYLQFKSSEHPSNIVQLEGLWNSVNDVSVDEIADIRKEMWSGFGEREI